MLCLGLSHSIRLHSPRISFFSLLLVPYPSLLTAVTRFTSLVIVCHGHLWLVSTWYKYS